MIELDALLARLADAEAARGAERTLRLVAERDAQEAQWVLAVVTGTGRLTRHEHARLKAALGHQPQGWRWLDDVQMWARGDEKP